MQVLYVLSFIIERVGVLIRPHSASLIDYIPALWSESSDHNMLRCAILSTLIHLVQVSLNPLQYYFILFYFVDCFSDCYLNGLSKNSRNDIDISIFCQISDTIF